VVSLCRAISNSQNESKISRRLLSVLTSLTVILFKFSTTKASYLDTGVRHGEGATVDRLFCVQVFVIYVLT
jgi:hypothetical protein